MWFEYDEVELITSPQVALEALASNKKRRWVSDRRYPFFFIPYKVVFSRTSVSLHN